MYLWSSCADASQGSEGGIGVCGGNDDCLPWTDLMVVGGDNQITLSWDRLDDRGLSLIHI